MGKLDYSLENVRTTEVKEKKCSSLKTGYETEKIARESLGSIKKQTKKVTDYKTGKRRRFRSAGQKSNNKIPIRTYFCKECRQWHLTSMLRNNKTIHH